MSERGKLLQHLVRTGERGAAIDDPLAAPRRRHAQAAGAYTYDVHTEGERGGQKIPQFCGFSVHRVPIQLAKKPLEKSLEKPLQIQI